MNTPTHRDVREATMTRPDTHGSRQERAESLHSASWQATIASLMAALDAGNSAAATAAAQQAVVEASDPEEIAESFRLLGDALLLGGDAEAAQVALEKAAWMYRGALLYNLGRLSFTAQDLPTAEHYTREALAIFDVRDDPASSGGCAARAQLASIVSARGRQDEAVTILRTAIECMETHYGPAHREVAVVVGVLGEVYERAGQVREAESAYRRSLRIYEIALGSEHPELAATLLDLGRLLDRAGDRRAGRELARRAATNLSGKVVDEHHVLRAAHRRLAEVDPRNQGR